MKSVWEVIREHDDYKFASSPYPGTGFLSQALFLLSFLTFARANPRCAGARSMNRYTALNIVVSLSINSLQLTELGARLSDQIGFNTVRQNNKRIVLCIDYSTSMNEVIGATTKYRQVIQAATQYVKGLSINTHIALVGFSRKPQESVFGLNTLDGG